MNLLIVLFVVVHLETQSILCKKSPDYGPYELEWIKYEICKGPKESCGKVYLKNTKTNMSDVIFGMEVEKDCALTMVKIIVNRKLGNTTKNIQSLSLNQPCQHYLFGPILKARFNMTKSCNIPKGKFEHHIDVVRYVTAYIGPKFFYGVYSFKTLIYNRIFHLACYDAVIGFKRK